VHKELPVRFFNDKFEGLLEFAKLTEDRAGKPRTLSGLRHSYATQELLSGTDTHTCQAIGHQCANVGTALQQIDDNHGG
jgi:hypothetical protein